MIHKAHLERLLLGNLDRVRSVLDGGGGYGRFSILLAKLGLKVTHLDISAGMIAKARELAFEAGIDDNITFIHAAIEEISAFRDKQFDLVISFDAPISYAYPGHESVIGDLIRVADKRVCFSVFSRPGLLTYLVNPTQKQKYIINNALNAPLLQWYTEHEQALIGSFTPDFALAREVAKDGLIDKPADLAAAYEKGETPWPVSYAFMPEELSGIMERFGAKNIRLAGPGALSRSIPGEVLATIIADEQLKREFLDVCYWYDSQPWCAGMGKDFLVADADL
jgi:ubiquinone/menaquinone biosynthesis C-methylase UbiE